MANKTQSGQLFSARSMNGIIEIDDGQGTIISGGIIQTNDINTANLTSDFITANNLLEANVDETITGKWTFSQTPYITQAPTDANDAVHKSYVDDNFVGLLGTQNIIGTKTFENAFMSASYTPVSAKQITTKEYVDAVGTPTIESVLQQGNDANGETITGLSNLTMNTGYTPTLDLEVSTKNYSDVFTGKIDATNNSFFSTIELFNPPFQVSGTTTIPVGTYTIQSLLTQIATSLSSTFSATISPSVVITEWTYDITTNKVSAILPSNSTIPELTHRIDPLLQLLGWEGGRTPPFTNIQLFNNAPAVIAPYPQHLPHLKDYVDDNFLNIANNPILTNIRDNSLVNGTLQLYYNNSTGEIGKVLSVNPIIDLEYVLNQGNDANGNSMTGLSNLTMDTGYSPSTALEVATKDYVDSAVAGGGITEGLLFDNNGNSRFQKITGATPPTPFYGYSNTTIGFESAKQMPTDILTGRNTFLGYRAGWYFGQGYVGSTDNTFLGHLAGWNGVNTGYGFNRTTCVGYRSYADKNDQVALGDGNGEIRARGSLLVDGYATFNGSGQGLIVNTISSFTQNIYRKIGSISYEVIDQLSILAYQTIANLATSYISNDTTYFSTKYIYDNFYTKSFSLATFFQKASIQFNYDLTPSNDECYSTSFLNPHIDAITKRTPKYFSAWYYSSQSTSFTGLSQWFNGAVAFSHYSPLTSNLGNSVFTIGEQVPAGTEDINQMSQYGTWTANISGMYNVECVLAMYPSFQMELYIEKFSGGSWSVEAFFRLRHQVSISGSNPYGVPFNLSKMIYLNATDSIRIRGNASGSLNYGYVYTYYKHSYLQITRMTGYT